MAAPGAPGAKSLESTGYPQPRAAACIQTRAAAASLGLRARPLFHFFPQQL